MTDGPISLQRATEDSAALFSNLLELYAHDLSEIFPVAIGADGRFGYETFPPLITRFACSFLSEGRPRALSGL